MQIFLLFVQFVQAKCQVFTKTINYLTPHLKVEVLFVVIVIVYGPIILWL